MTGVKVTVALQALAATLLLSSTTSGQTPRATTNLVADVVPAGVAVNSPWVGAQSTYNFSGSDQFADNLLVAGLFIYDPMGKKKSDGDEVDFHMLVAGNIASLADPSSSTDQVEERTQQLLISSQGINFGLYPYWVALSSIGWRLTLQGSAGVKVNSFNDTQGGTTYMPQFRFSAGAEVAYGAINDGKSPVTLSVTPTFTSFSAEDYELAFGERKSSLLSLDFTVVAPVKNGVGGLAEWIVAEKSRSVFRLGVLFATKVQ